MALSLISLVRLFQLCHVKIISSRLFKQSKIIFNRHRKQFVASITEKLTIFVCHQLLTMPTADLLAILCEEPGKGRVGKAEHTMVGE
jgi:hypothetical protein